MDQNFEGLVKKDKYQVFVMYCPIYFPFNYIKHGWFAVNKKGVISRYEVRHYKVKKDHNFFHVNAQLPFNGINLTFFVKKHFWKAKLLGYLEGDENSIAQKTIEFIENSEKTYPYCYRYNYFGPNSNSYVQNVFKCFSRIQY